MNPRCDITSCSDRAAWRQVLVLSGGSKITGLCFCDRHRDQHRTLASCMTDDAWSLILFGMMRLGKPVPLLTESSLVYRELTPKERNETL